MKYKLIFICLTLLIVFANVNAKAESNSELSQMTTEIEQASYRSGFTEQTKFIPKFSVKKEVISKFDKNSNNVEDSIDKQAAETMEIDKRVSIIVGLNQPVKKTQLRFFQLLGGKVTHVYDAAMYGFAGNISLSKIPELVQYLGDSLYFISPDQKFELHADKGASLIRARPIVWNTYGYRGDSNFSVAVLDTGMDDSHIDLQGYQNVSIVGWNNLNAATKFVGWHDATGDNSVTPEDFNGHGSHVAGIVAGTGSAHTNSGISNITTTFTGAWVDSNGNPLPIGSGYVNRFEATTGININLTIRWNGGGNAFLELRNSGGVTLTSTSGTSPLSVNWVPTYSGIYEVLPVPNDLISSGNAYSVQINRSYTGPNDAYNLFAGVAPNARLVGVKVFANDALTSDLIGGINWVIHNREIYRIRVASMSAGIINGGTDPNMRNAANNLVGEGVVFVISAGNDYPTHTIGDPALAERVITVAATNDFNNITDYSSNGPQNTDPKYTIDKPDVAAPGGSASVGSEIESVDTNDNDGENSVLSMPDQILNDYSSKHGTSMSAPYVAGTAALVIQALNRTGEYAINESNAQKVKNILLLTAYEVQNGESTNVPSLNRSEKDRTEGYGRISADAAIEAVTLNYTVGTIVSDTLGEKPTDKKVWARWMNLISGKQYNFNLSIPATSDYDLYIYNGNPDANGDPIILKKSTIATIGAAENISYIPSISGTYYLLVKWVNGNGTFHLSSSFEKDYFGYTYIDSNTPGGPTYDWIEINTTGTKNETLNNSDDHYVDNIPVGFFFNFYGTDYSQLSITNNGLILASGGTSQYTNQPIGSSTPHNFIAPFWDDIVTWGSSAASTASRQINEEKESKSKFIASSATSASSAPPGAIYYQTLGTAPNRMFVVEWYDNQHYQNSESGVTFEAILYEGSNNIKFQYKDVEFGTVYSPFSGDYPPFDKGGSATVGIEGSDGSGLQYSYNQQVPSPGLAILFKFPQYAGTNLYLSKQAPASKDRNNTIIYTLYYHNFGDTASANAVLNDTLPHEVEFISASDGGSYNPLTRNVTWNIGSVIPGGHGYENVTVKINQSAAIGTVIQNNAIISNSNIEVRYDDNEAHAQTRVTGSSLPPDVSVEPNNGGDTPSIVWHTPITFTYNSSCATGVGINIHINDGGSDITGTMVETSPDTWTYTTTFSRTGAATINYSVSGCTAPSVSFSIYIDPAGYIYDADTGARISGASVWLQRPDGTGGWENVPTGQTPPIMQPDANPLITGVNGSYQWDVMAGSYRVHVEAPGYNPANSIVVSVPPPVFDLNVGLTYIGSPLLLVSSVTPNSRIPQVGIPVTVFMSVVNGGTGTATGVSITQASSLPVSVSYQQWNGTAFTSWPNTPVDIPGGGTANFVLSINATSAFNSSSLTFNVSSTNGAIGSISRVNTMIISGSAVPYADVIMMSTNLNLSTAVNTTTAFAVATSNVGGANATGVSLILDIPSAITGLLSQVNQTNPATGAIIGPATGLTIAVGGTPTFAVFLTPTQPIAYDPANNRITLQLVDGSGKIIGAQSVAVSTT